MPDRRLSERVLITGVTGKIGLALAQRLVADGHRVVGLTRRKDAAAQLEEVGVEPLVARFEDRPALVPALRQTDRLFHLAGGVRGRGAEGPEAVNQGLTGLLLEAMREARPSALQAFVYASSMAVYGDRSGLWVTEDLPVLPHTRYGHAKVAAERLVLAAAEEQQLPVRIGRIAAVYGPGFPILMADRIKAGRGWLPGEGRNIVATVHIDDTVAALELLAHSDAPGQITNIADKVPRSNREFYALVHAAVGGRPMRFWSTWIPSYVQLALAQNNEALMSRLGRRPRFTPDALKLFTASTRLGTERLEKELGFTWRWPDAAQGVPACFS